MKIVWNIAGFYRPAGMERALALKANWFASKVDENGEPLNEVLIVTTEQKGREPAFPLDSRIRMVDLGIGYEDNNGGSFADKLIHYPGRLFSHRKALKALLKEEKPDITVSMFCNEASFLPGIKAGGKKVLEVHFSRFKRLQYGRKGIWALADKWRCAREAKIAARYDRFVVLTEEDKSFWGDIPHISVIPNARTFRPSEPAALDARQVLAVGRYNFQKAFDRLLEAWKLIGDKTNFWTLRIAGDGEDREKLERKAWALGISNSVVFGPESDMPALYAGSSVLALSSRFEGLPMVLLEAQAAGLPIVSFACKCGPRDVITDGVDGYLVEEGDVAGLASKLAELMGDRQLRRRMGAAAYQASDRYELENIMHQWEMLFKGL